MLPYCTFCYLASSVLSSPLLLLFFRFSSCSAKVARSFCMLPSVQFAVTCGVSINLRMRVAFVVLFGSRICCQSSSCSRLSLVRVVRLQVSTQYDNKLWPFWAFLKTKQQPTFVARFALRTCRLCWKTSTWSGCGCVSDISSRLRNANLVDTNQNFAKHGPQLLPYVLFTQPADTDKKQQTANNSSEH